MCTGTIAATLALMDTTPDPIEAELRASQAAYVRAQAAAARRREAVNAARAADWKTYRIAKTLGVDESTVRAILNAKSDPK